MFILLLLIFSCSKLTPHSCVLPLSTPLGDLDPLSVQRVQLHLLEGVEEGGGFKLDALLRIAVN